MILPPLIFGPQIVILLTVKRETDLVNLMTSKSLLKVCFNVAR